MNSAAGSSQRQGAADPVAVSDGVTEMAYGTLRVRKRQTLALLLTLPLVLHNNETAKKPGRQEYQKRSFIVLCGN